MANILENFIKAMEADNKRKQQTKNDAESTLINKNEESKDTLKKGKREQIKQEDPIKLPKKYSDIGSINEMREYILKDPDSNDIAYYDKNGKYKYIANELKFDEDPKVQKWARHYLNVYNGTGGDELSIEANTRESMKKDIKHNTPYNDGMKEYSEEFLSFIADIYDDEMYKQIYEDWKSPERISGNENLIVMPEIDNFLTDLYKHEGIYKPDDVKAWIAKKLSK